MPHPVSPAPVDHAAIAAAAARLDGRIVATPTLRLNQARMHRHLPAGCDAHMKLELFQQAGSFKTRGVLLAIDALDETSRAAGVTAVSAGNHALAVAWGARDAGLSAKVVMPRTADPVRVAGCEAMGAEVVLVDDVGVAFATADALVRDEGRTMLHPFESDAMMLGAATVGAELARAVPDGLDAAIVPIGGGGLIAGMAVGIGSVHPACEIIGVEPEGADSMSRSFRVGEPVRLEAVRTIADSLGAPMALPLTYEAARRTVSRIVRLPESAFPPAMRLMFDALKLVAEPACAASLAALTGPLREEMAGRRVAVIACGSNISLERFAAIAG